MNNIKRDIDDIDFYYPIIDRNSDPEVTKAELTAYKHAKENEQIRQAMIRHARFNIKRVRALVNLGIK